LQSRLDKGGGEGSVVSIHDKVDGGEKGKGFVSPAENFIRDNAAPEWIECRNGEDGVSSVGSKVEVVERKLSVKNLTSRVDRACDLYLGGIPHEIYDAISERLCSSGVSARSRAVGRSV
jgi:hypothetical protein